MNMLKIHQSGTETLIPVDKILYMVKIPSGQAYIYLIVSPVGYIMSDEMYDDIVVALSAPRVP